MIQDPEIRSMQDEYHERHRLLRRWIITENVDGTYTMHEHTHDGVAPPTSYPTRMAVAARLLQLMGLDMVAAQQHPEAIFIGSVNGEPLGDSQSAIGKKS